MIRSVASSRVRSGSVPVSTSVLPASGPFAGRRALLLEAQPGCAQVVDQRAHLLVGELLVDQRGHLRPDARASPRSARASAASSASIVRKRCARLRPVTSPTSSIPIANSTRAERPLACEASIARDQRCARRSRRSPRARAAARRVSAVEVGGGAAPARAPCSSATCFSPRPSMSIAPRETKCLSSCQRAPGAVAVRALREDRALGLDRRRAAERAARRRPRRRRAVGALDRVRRRRDDLRDHVARRAARSPRRRRGCPCARGPPRCAASRA